MILFKTSLSLHIAILFTFGLTASMAQEIDYGVILERLERIERNIEDLQKNKIEDLEKNISSGYISRTEQRFGNLETQYQSNFGKIEEIENKIEKLRERFNLFDQEVNSRLNEISRKLDNLDVKSSENQRFEKQNLFSNSEQNQTGIVDETPVSEQISQKETKTLYENAIKLLWSNELDEALKELLKLRNANPEDLMPNIQYWLGEVYYAKKNFEQAVIEFGEGLKLYPTSIKGPDNMLKLGLSFSNLNRKLESCNVLIELEVKYPEAAKNVLQRAKTEKNKLKCSEE